jgi:DNA-binding NtrC family response regulator
LRERLSDIPLLVAHFITRFNAEKKQSLTGITPAALQMLQSYHWPGNVRELENTMERIAILKGHGMIVPEDLPEKIFRPLLARRAPGVTIPDDGIDFDATVATFEKQLLMQALAKAGGVKSKAAHLLHMNRTTLVEKVKKLHLESD